MELEDDDDILSLSYEDLVTYTDDFSESNYLGYFQFGKFYRGKIVSDEKKTRLVMVKIWEVPEIYNYVPGDNEGRLMDEVNFHLHELAMNRPGLSSLYGFCLESGHLGVVYDLNLLDTVCNLVPKDDFTWLQRIKVALVLAHLLKFLHTRKDSYYKSFVVRNLDCAHLVLDEDYNMKLCDFGMITGGIFPDRTIFKCHHVIGSYGYIDLSSFYAGDCSDKKDVYAFGTILLSLISKRVYNKDVNIHGMFVSDWAMAIYKKHAMGDPVFDLDENYQSDYDWARVLYENPESKPPKFSLVHQSLAAEPDYDIGDGLAITSLAYKCIDDLDERPTMNQVFKKLLKLKAVKRNAEFLELNKLMRDNVKRICP